ncbi:MAG TPA: hypothetical protein VJS91_09330, partial [Nitrososphaeraceae archaeon]|nr:hypothetical protein [Nitrososphaeraceae archaeon]
MAEDENKTGNVQNDITDIEKGDNSSISYSEGNLHDASENLRKEAKKIGEEDKTSPDNVPDDKPKLETIRGDRVRENPGKVEKIRTSAGIFSRKPIVVVLIIGVIILGGVL